MLGDPGTFAELHCYRLSNSHRVSTVWASVHTVCRSSGRRETFWRLFRCLRTPVLCNFFQEPFFFRLSLGFDARGFRFPGAVATVLLLKRPDMRVSHRCYHLH